MAKTFIKELQEKVELLQDGFDIKSIEHSLLENEMVDMLRPSRLLSDLSGYLLEMTEELTEHVKKKGLTPAAKKSQERLIKLIHLSTQLNILGVHNQSLKLFNKELVGKIQLLRIDRAELNRQITNMINAENFNPQ